MKRRILVAEDDDDLRQTLAEILELEGYEVDTAEDGQVALDKLNRGTPPDLMVLDLRMPRKSGHDVLHEIRDLPHLLDLPIVVLTAETKNPPLGAVAWLRKPALPSLLLAVVANYLRRKVGK